MNPSEGLKVRETHYQHTHKDQSEQTWGSGGGQNLTKYHPTPDTHLLSAKGKGDPAHGFMQRAAVSSH